MNISMIISQVCRGVFYAFFCNALFKYLEIDSLGVLMLVIICTHFGFEMGRFEIMNK